MKRWKQRLAAAVLGVVFVLSLTGGLLTGATYFEQFRDDTSVAPSPRFPLGTDELGRDRFARLLYGTRVSLLLAPAAAVLSTLLAAVAGGLAGYLGGRWDRTLTAFIDLFLSLPWLFLLLTVRALLPLNTSPELSVTVTFVLLGLLGWPAAARVVRSGMGSVRQADYLLLAHAQGQPKTRIFFRAALPNLRPVLTAQFLLAVPMYLVGEASLGLLGLGVSEPLPSWGSLLRELEAAPFLTDEPWLFAPLVLLVICLLCFQALLPEEEVFG